MSAKFHSYSLSKGYALCGCVAPFQGLGSGVEKIKSHSSKCIKTLDESLANFYWQDGYGAFSVNPWDTEGLIRYISNQHEHHTKKSFQDEYRGILKKHKIKYDERYVWD